MNKRLCKKILCIVLVVGSIIILYNMFQSNDYEGLPSDYQKFTGKHCSNGSLDVCVADTESKPIYSESKCGVTTGNAGRDCDRGGHALDHDNGKRYTHEQCAKACLAKGKQNNWSKIWMTHGRKVGATNSQCTGKNDKCRCYCSNACKGSDGKGKGGRNPYRTYDLSKCPSGKNTCGNIPWAIYRNGKTEDGAHCPLVDNNFDINNAYDIDHLLVVVELTPKICEIFLQVQP